jgi:uncharacterized membrane protein YczE
MTGLVRRTGGSVRLVRTTIEIAVVLTGWALGGTLGIATVLYALTIGPLVQLFLPHLTVHPNGSSPQTGRPRDNVLTASLFELFAVKRQHGGSH